jgi:hypothetical protein
MPGGMEAIQLSAAVLRNQAPELVLRLGSTVAARVLERHGARGLITIGNAVLAAELPEQVRTGDRLRLLVHDATGDRVTLKLVEQDAAPQQPQLAAVPLPNGARARIEPDDQGPAGQSRGERSVALTYNSPALGAMRFRLSLDPGAVAVTVRASPGMPLEAAERGAAELRDALARATGRAARVTVLPREDPVDVYA